MKKVLSIFAVLFACVFCLVGCTPNETDGKETFATKIAVVTDVGQLMDGGFNQGTYEGAMIYGGNNGILVKYFQPANGTDATDADRVNAMSLAIEWGAGVIVAPGFLQAAAMAESAEANPNVKYLFIDGFPLNDSKGNNLLNVTSINYKEQESGYFAGYAAVMDGYTKLGGTFGGGGANAACNRFAYGYVQGIKAAAAKKSVNCTVTISFKFGDGFSASDNLAAQISGWYQNGTEVVFSCGGSMLQSVKAAAKEHTNAKIIGVDVDQANESDRVITSAVKGLSVSVQNALDKYYDGKWDQDLAGKVLTLGAVDDSTGLPTSTSSWRFSTFKVADYQTLFAQVKAGTLVIDGTTADDMNVAATWSAMSDSKVTVTLEK